MSWGGSPEQLADRLGEGKGETCIPEARLASTADNGQADSARMRRAPTITRGLEGGGDHRRWSPERSPAVMSQLRSHFGAGTDGAGESPSARTVWLLGSRRGGSRWLIGHRSPVLSGSRGPDRAARSWGPFEIARHSLGPAISDCDGSSASRGFPTTSPQTLTPATPHRCIDDDDGTRAPPRTGAEGSMISPRVG